VEEGVFNVAEDITLDKALMEEREIKKTEMIAEFMKKKTMIVSRDKNELTRNCFWIPDLTPNYIPEEKDKPSDKLLCPFNEKDHYIRLKDLSSLKISMNEADDKFVCKTCKKELSYQKIVALKSCGEVFCKKCLDITCKDANICPSCSKPFSETDVINLKESGTGYSSHNSVQTTKLNPFFKC